MGIHLAMRSRPEFELDEPTERPYAPFHADPHRAPASYDDPLSSAGKQYVMSVKRSRAKTYNSRNGSLPVL